MDPHQEAVLRKIALRFVPLLTLAFVVNYLDRTNIAVAALAMNQDLGLSATEFGLGAGILFRRLYHFRNPVKPRALSVRRAALDRAHHDHLGIGVDRNGSCLRRQHLLCGAVSLRDRRGRIFCQA